MVSPIHRIGCGGVVSSVLTNSSGVLLLDGGRGWDTEFSEAAFKVFIQKCIEDWVQAAVCVAQSNAEVPGDRLERGFRDGYQGFDDDVNVDGRPADDEHSHHHQHHPGDAPQVPVLFFGAREHADTLEAQDHQSITHCDDEDGHDEGEDENTDLQQVLPVPGRVGER